MKMVLGPVVSRASHVRKMETQPIPSRGAPKRGRNQGVYIMLPVVESYKWTKWLTNPCDLGVPQAGTVAASALLNPNQVWCL